MALRGGVNYNGEDRFAINGQRLMAVKGDYGADGTTYRTEIDSWTRYYSQGNCGSGPCSFIAYTKTGDLLEFGTSDNARVLAQGKPEVNIWAGNKHTDKNGNYLTIDYVNDTAIGEYYPVGIDYTGNSHTDLDPQRSVTLTYEDRPDNNIYYLAGSKVARTKRIKEITTYVNQKMVNNYQFTYRTSEITGHSLLENITQCDAQGNCLIPTKFTWNNRVSSTHQFSDQPWANLNTHWTDQSTTAAGDYNSDGLTDISYIYNDAGKISMLVSLSNGSSFQTAQMWSKQQGTWTQGSFPPGDYNGDGMVDIAHVYNRSGYIAIDMSLSNRKTFTSSSWYTPTQMWSEGAKIQPGDFNGDGKLDLAYAFNDQGTLAYYIYLSKGDQFVYSDELSDTTSSVWMSDGIVRAADFNADGLTDLAYAFSNSGNLQVNLSVSTGNSLLKNTWKSDDLDWVDGKLLNFSDYNGDGKTDLCYFYNNKGYVSAKVMLCQGNTFKQVSTWSDSKILWKGPQMIKSSDYNGDGFIDVAYLFKNDNNQISIHTYLSNGKSFKAYNTLESPSPWGDNKFYLPSDYNGDGKADIAHVFNQGTVGFNMYLSEENPQSSPYDLEQYDLLSSVVNGYGSQISTQHKPLTDRSVYEKDNASEVFPTVKVTLPSYVVSQSAVYDSISKTRSTINYTYKNAKVNLQGRGWLGFEETTRENISDQNPMLHTTTTKKYEQDFPLTGKIIGQKQSRSYDGVALKKTTFEYGYTNAALSQPNSEVYVVYRESKKRDTYSNGVYNYSQSQEYSYDKDFKLLTGVSVLNEDPNENYYTCIEYQSDMNAPWWHGFYPIAKKISNAPIGSCDSLWSSDTDLRSYGFTYDKNMNTTQKRAWSDQLEQWVARSYTYDPYGNITSSTDPLGNTTNIAYETTYHSFPKNHTLPVIKQGVTALSTQMEFEPAFGTCVKYTDANGNTTLEIPENGIDGFGRILKVNGIQANSKELIVMAHRSFMQNADIGLYSQTKQRLDWQENDPKQWLTQNHYFDGLARTYQSQTEGGSAIKSILRHTQYNNRGLVEKRTLPYYENETAHYTSYTYNIERKLIERNLPEQITNTVNYDPTDHRIATAYKPNPANTSGENTTVSTTTIRDNRGHVIKHIDANSAITTAQYDPLGQQTNMTDPLGVQTSYTYNSLGQVVQRDNTESGTTLYTYYATGLLESKTDASGKRKHYRYDPLGRAIEQNNYKADKSLEKTIMYSYDTAVNGKGRLAAMTTPEVSYSYAYDYRGNVSGKTTTTLVSDKPSSFTNSYLYNAAGQITQITFPDNSKIHYNYDGYGRFSEVANQQAGSSTTQVLVQYKDYTALGKSQTIDFNNKVHAYTGYDPLGRIQKSQTTSTNTSLRDFTYTWNKASKILAINDTRTGPAQNLSQIFTYNTMGYLETAKGEYGNKNYQYNLTGDITQYNNTLYSYDPTKKHQLTGACQIDENNNLCQPSLKLSYDDLGNTSTKTVRDTLGKTTDWQYRYDAENNLTQITKTDTDQVGTLVNDFSYNNSWKRVKKVNADGSASYYISPYYIIEVDSTGTQKVTKYIKSPQGTVASITDSGEISYYHLNHIGSTTLITDEKGEEKTQVSYKPYGEIDKKNSDISQKFIPKFTGKELDSKSGLYYFGARYYDPDLKRFTTPDPAKQMASPYVYVGNNPIANVDPDGRLFWEIEVLSDIIDAVLNLVADEAIQETEAEFAQRRAAIEEASKRKGEKSKASKVFSRKLREATGYNINAVHVEAEGDIEVIATDRDQVPFMSIIPRRDVAPLLGSYNNLPGFRSATNLSQQQQLEEERYNAQVLKYSRLEHTFRTLQQGINIVGQALGNQVQEIQEQIQRQTQEQIQQVQSIEQQLHPQQITNLSFGRRSQIQMPQNQIQSIHQRQTQISNGIMQELQTINRQLQHNTFQDQRLRAIIRFFNMTQFQ